MSDTDRWHHVEAVFAEAADLAPADRAAFLDRSCRRPDGTADAALREEVESLLAHDLAAEAFFGSARERLAAVAGSIAGERAESQAEAPERVGPWRLVRQIGQGGMGTVHLAERDDGRFEQTTALKLVRPGLADGLVDRFRAERQILARLDHPAIARLIDGGQADDGRPFLVMEYVDGEPITAYCDRRRLTVNERIALFESVCEAVQFAHGRLVVHRDLKPSNVLVAETAAGPRVKLLDFGIAKLLGDGADTAMTTADERVMTPEYAAPEQVRGEPATTATDVYGLGVLLYELLTGARPYRLEHRARRAVEQAILDDVPTEPSTAVAEPAADARSTDTARLRRRLRGDLDHIVLCALRKEPARRYAGAAALAADLGRHVAGLPVEARPESAAYRLGRFVRRHRAGIVGMAAVLVAVLAGAGVALWQAAEADRHRAAAEREAATSARVATFMTDLFRDSNSADVRSDTVSARDLLDQGLDRVDSLADSPDVQADLLGVLGEIYGRLGRFDEARTAYARVVEIRRAQGDSLSVVGALAALARVRFEERAFPESIQIYHAAVERAQAAGAPDSLRASLTLGLSEALLQNGDLGGALLALDAAAPFLDWRFPADAPQPQAVRSLQAKILVRQSDFAGAQRLYRENIRQLRASGDEPRLASELNALAFALRRGGDPAAALPVYQEALAILERTDREGHRNRSVVLGNIAGAAFAAGNPAAAEAALLSNLELETTYQESGHWRIGSAHGSLADFYGKAGRVQPALLHGRRRIGIYEAALGPDHPWTATARAALGLSLLTSGDADGGARELDGGLRALHERQASGNAFDSDTAAAIARLAGALNERGLAERARSFRELLPR